MSSILENFLKLRTHLTQVKEQEDGWIIAFLDYLPQDLNLTTLVTDLYDQGVISEIRNNKDLIFPKQLKNAGVFLLRIDPGKLSNYFETYDSLIKSNPEAAPESFTVWEKNAEFEKGYAAACSLLKLLREKVEVWDSTARRFYLVDLHALEIPFDSYRAFQTVTVPSSLANLNKFLDSRHLDADVRWAFLRKACLRLLRNVPKERRLGGLMERIEIVDQRSQQDHSLYLERFSFEDLLKNFDEKRLRFVGDFNQILTSIQTALVAVPIGFFLIAEKFKPAHSWTGQNIVIASGGIVFFGLVFVLSLNQGQTLKAVKLALVDFESEQRRRVTEKSERLNKLFTDTWAQYRRVRLFLLTVQILVVLSLLVIVLTLAWCSLPGLQHSFSYFPQEPQAVTTNAVTIAPVSQDRVRNLSPSGSNNLQTKPQDSAISIRPRTVSTSTSPTNDGTGPKKSASTTHKIP